SPRRSHRGGHSKSKKEKVEEVDEDDGGTTRCVCNQQHHEGVMIQCETCKVWQHCPCVGLGNGEVTPDKYYCDSCRPENHPYSVQDGQPISNSKRAQQVSPSTAPAGSKAKPSKKKSMNSKDTSGSVDLSSHYSKNNNKDDDEWVEAAPSTKRNNIDDDDLSMDVNHSTHTRTSKRRKRASINSDDNDVATTNGKHRKRSANGKQRSGDSSPEETDKETDMPPSSPPLSPKTSTKSTKGSKATKAKRPSSTSNAFHSNKNSIHSLADISDAKDEESSHHDDDQDAESSPTPSTRQPQSGRRAIGKKNSRPLEEDTTLTEKSTAISNKRKKTTKSEQHQQQEAALQNDNHDQDMDPSISNESIEDPPDATSSFAAVGQNNGYDGTKNAGERFSSPPPTMSKKASYRRVAMQRTSSDSPTPSGTPQPMPPAPPCKVKYPSAKMPLKDMMKRAQQLLDYINRAQVEMADLKSKREQSSTPMLTDTPSTSTAAATSTPAASSPSSSTMSLAGSRGKYQHQITVDTEMKTLGSCNKVGSTDATDAHWLSTPPQSVHEMSHGDTAEQSMMTCHPKQADQAESSIEGAAVPLGSDPEPGKGKEPMTPPHQPNGQDDNAMELTNKGDEAHTKNHTGPAQVESDRTAEEPCKQDTCQDLINKLTRDLINFQEKFGRTVD
ncbi:hypothetical protein BGX34_003918, partial [Mortierella sp. NVP85]